MQQLDPVPFLFLPTVRYHSIQICPRVMGKHILRATTNILSVQRSPVKCRPKNIWNRQKIFQRKVYYNKYIDTIFNCISTQIFSDLYLPCGATKQQPPKNNIIISPSPSAAMQQPFVNQRKCLIIPIQFASELPDFFLIVLDPIYVSSTKVQYCLGPSFPQSHTWVESIIK